MLNFGTLHSFIYFYVAKKVIMLKKHFPSVITDFVSSLAFMY